MQRAFLILIGLILFFNLNAQTGKRTRLGFLLSPQISWLNSDHESVNSNGSKFGYNFGLLVDHFFDTNYAITTGLTINTSGGKLTYDLQDMDGNAYTSNETYQLKYLEIPLGLKLLTNEFHRSRFYGQFGLYGQFNIKAVDENGKSRTDQIKSFDMGYNLGGGIEYSIGGDTFLTFGLLYHNGILDATNHYLSDKTHLNRLVFQFGVIF